MSGPLPLLWTLGNVFGTVTSRAVVRARRMIHGVRPGIQW